MTFHFDTVELSQLFNKSSLVVCFLMTITKTHDTYLVDSNKIIRTYFITNTYLYLYKDLKLFQNSTLSKEFLFQLLAENKMIRQMNSKNIVYGSVANNSHAFIDISVLLLFLQFHPITLSLRENWNTGMENMFSVNDTYCTNNTFGEKF